MFWSYLGDYGQGTPNLVCTTVTVSLPPLARIQLQGILKNFEELQSPGTLRVFLP